MILHVVLYHNPQLPPLVSEDGQMVPIVEMATQLPEKWEQLCLVELHRLRSTITYPDTTVAYCLKLASNVCTCLCRRLPNNSTTTKDAAYSTGLGYCRTRGTAAPQFVCCTRSSQLEHTLCRFGTTPTLVRTGLGYYFNHGYVNLHVALVLNCVDCFQRLHRML